MVGTKAEKGLMTHIQNLNKDYTKSYYHNIVKAHEEQRVYVNLAGKKNPNGELVPSLPHEHPDRLTKWNTAQEHNDKAHEFLVKQHHLSEILKDIRPLREWSPGMRIPEGVMEGGTKGAGGENEGGGEEGGEGGEAPPPTQGLSTRTSPRKRKSPQSLQGTSAGASPKDSKSKRTT